MFRKLAEAFQNDSATPSQPTHQQYVNQQNAYFNALPNMILAPSSGLKGFDTAIQSVDSLGSGYQKEAVKFPNQIFMTDMGGNMSQQAKQCATSSIDDLIAIKNPNASVGCGWIYTPPNDGSPYPNVSQGALGTAAGPASGQNLTNYKQWFFDLQLAKKQMLMDKCKALSGCSDVDSNVFNGVCGYCTDTNIGVPIDAAGQPLYGNDVLGNCSPQSLVISSVNCPVPPGPGAGPQPVVDKTCVAVDGRLSVDCLYSKLLSAGCSDNGALAVALANPTSPSNYIGNLTNGDAVKIYNRVANPPLKLDVFSQGATTVDVVLQEARQLAGNATQPANSALGAAARDLCLQKGAIANFDFCSDLADSSPPPFDVGCLQKLFLKMGGLPAGQSYPSQSNSSAYNTFGSLGAVKQYLNQLASDTKSSDYNTQRNAMIQLFGISPEKLIARAPYTQGIEVFWFVATPGQPNKVQGFLRRTLEQKLVQVGGGAGPDNAVIPQIGLSQYFSMLQMTDVRTPSNFGVKWQILTDDGFWIAVNQPANAESKAFGGPNDAVGLFSNLQISGPTVYQSNSCSNFNGGLPNIMKMFYTDSGAAGHTFNLNTVVCNGTQTFTQSYFSLTCEPRAPFLNFEVSPVDNAFEEVRMPGAFSQFITSNGLEYHMRSEEKTNVPGGKGFVRLNSANSSIRLSNIAYQSWGTVTFALRLQTMPVKETVFSFLTGSYYYNVIAQPINGSMAALSIEHNLSGTVQTVSTPFQLSLGQWYLVFIANKGTGFDLYSNTFANLIANQTTPSVSANAQGQLYLQNATMSPAPGQPQSPCSVVVGTSGLMNLKGMYSTSSFNYDIAWAHFFDHYTNGNDIYRDCMANWIFTQFPDSANTYSTLS